MKKGAVMSRLASYNSGPLGPLAGRRLTHSFAHEFDSTSFDGSNLEGRSISKNIAGIPILTGNLKYLANKVSNQLGTERRLISYRESYIRKGKLFRVMKNFVICWTSKNTIHGRVGTFLVLRLTR